MLTNDFVTVLSHYDCYDESIKRNKEHLKEIYRGGNDKNQVQ